MKLELVEADYEKEKELVDGFCYYIARYIDIAIRVLLQECVWLQLNMSRVFYLLFSHLLK